MEAHRASIWDWGTGLAGLVLLISMFTHWYESNGTWETAFQSFKLIDKILLLTALLAIALPITAMLANTPGVAQKLNLITVVLGVLSTACVIFRLADTPQIVAVIQPIHIKPGAYVGLVATIGIVVLGWLAIMARRSARADSHVRARRAQAA
jgi:hypothetical protein